MSNKKLYTEEQIKLMLEETWAYTPLQIDYMINTMKAIELPSDEEIREERLLQFPDSEYANRANYRLAFYCGAKSIIDKIQGGETNEQQHN